MWFYGMVGNSQARDPWLDEAFASWAEETVDGVVPNPGVLQLPGKVGGSTASFGSDENTYYTTVYGKGSAAITEASRQAGSQAFDKAIRCYVNANAWRIAKPSDLETALAGLPKALAVLKSAGALS